MRLTSLALLSGLSAFQLLGTAAAANDSDDSDAPVNTYFDSLPVPPLLELTPDNFEKEANNTKFLFVKHYRCLPLPPSFSDGKPSS